MKDLKQITKSESVTIRITKVEARSLQNEANTELLSISSLVRRKLFFNPVKATA